jgi:hypothetical protein
MLQGEERCNIPLFTAPVMRLYGTDLRPVARFPDFRDLHLDSDFSADPVGRSGFPDSYGTAFPGRFSVDRAV